MASLSELKAVFGIQQATLMETIGSAFDIDAQIVARPGDIYHVIDENDECVFSGPVPEGNALVHFRYDRTLVESLNPFIFLTERILQNARKI